MEQFRLPSDEVIGAANDQGKEAVIALIHQTVGQRAAGKNGQRMLAVLHLVLAGKPYHPLCVSMPT